MKEGRVDNVWFVRIVFDHLPFGLSSNRINDQHWGARNKQVNLAREAMDKAVEGLQLPMEPLTCVQLDFHFYRPNDLTRDPAALLERCKPYIDYLCPPRKSPKGKEIPGLSIIRDDSWREVQRIGVTHELRRNQPGFYIDIIDLGVTC